MSPELPSLSSFVRKPPKEGEMTTTESTGEQLRDRGIADVLDADHSVNRGVREHIERALEQLIERGRSFTSDEVHTLLPEDVQPHSPNLLPAVIRTFRTAERIRQVGWSTSTRPTRHGGVIRQWIGTAAPNVPTVPEQRRVRSGETPTETPSSGQTELPLI